MKRAAPSPDVSSLRSLITGYEASQVIHVAARLGVADLLAEGPQTAEVLAEALRLDAGALHRVLHALAALGLLEHLGESRYALGVVALVVTRSPLLLLVMVVGLFTLWQRWRHPVPGYDEIPRAQRLMIGAAYAGMVIALVATLPIGLVPHPAAGG